MISRFLILSAIAFSTIAAQNNNSELVKNLVTSPTNLERLQLLSDKEFKFDFAKAAGTVGAGGFTAAAHALTMPATIGNDISLTVGYLGPCGFNTPHIHSRSSELNYVLKGTLVAGFIAEDGARFVFNQVPENHAIIFPQGAIHFEYNPGCDNATFVAGFADSFPGVTQIGQRFFGLPSEVVAAALGIDQTDVQKYATMIPDNVALSIEECTKRCGINRPGQPTKQLQGAIPTETASGSNPSSTNNSTSNGSVKANLDSADESSQNSGLTIGLIVAIAVMGLGYIALAAFVIFRRRRSQRVAPRDYVLTGESFAPSGMHDSEKYDSREPLRTPYDPPSGSH